MQAVTILAAEGESIEVRRVMTDDAREESL